MTSGPSQNQVGELLWNCEAKQVTMLKTSFAEDKMAGRRVTQPNYSVSIYDDRDAAGALRFTFVPKGAPPARAEGSTPRTAPQYIVSVQRRGDETEFHWINPPAQRSTREELEEIARMRMTARHDWLEKLRKLVAGVKGWAEESGWSTRTLDKRMEDAEVGNHKAPGLLLQHDTVRLFLEPVARSAPGAEGFVDLYLMPSYDDIANLYYYNNRWNVHYLFKGEPAAGKVREAEPKPLTKATLRKVFDEMEAHAG